MYIQHLNSPQRRIDELPDLQELNQKFGSDPHFDFVGKEVFIAYNEIQIFGFGCIGEKDTKKVLRYDLVHPEYRGMGAQKKLIEARLKFLREEGSRKEVYAYVAPANQYSLNNLVGAGFRFCASSLYQTHGESYQQLKKVL